MEAIVTALSTSVTANIALIAPVAAVVLAAVVGFRLLKRFLS